MAPTSIQAFLSAYVFRSRFLNQPPPGPMARRTMSGITRAGKARGRGQVKGMRWEDVDAAIAASRKDDPSPRGHRDRALLALMSDALLRVSEAAVATWGDVEHLRDKGARLTVTHSKTDQEGKGVKLYIRQRTVDLLAEWAYAYSQFARKQVPACLHDDSVIFPRMNRNSVMPHRHGQPEPMNPEACRFIIKKMARRIGLKGVSGHSLRVGGAMSLAERGVDLVKMQLAGPLEQPQPTRPLRPRDSRLRHAGVRHRLSRPAQAPPRPPAPPLGAGGVLPQTPCQDSRFRPFRMLQLARYKGRSRRRCGRGRRGRGPGARRGSAGR